MLIFYFIFQYSFHFFNSFLVFIFILVSFLFHLSTFIFFFAIFFLCASNESFMCFICMLLFLVYPLGQLSLNSPKRTTRPFELSGKTQVPFTFAIVLLYVFNRTIYSISLRPPILRAFQPPAQPRSQAPLLLVPREFLAKEDALSPARFCVTRISS